MKLYLYVYMHMHAHTRRAASVCVRAYRRCECDLGTIDCELLANPDPIQFLAGPKVLFSFKFFL